MAGYWIVQGKSGHDENAAQRYAELWKPIAAKFGATIIAGPGGHVFKEGDAAARVFIVHFPSYDDALACYESPEYQAALLFASRAYVRSLVIVEGR